MEFIIFNCTRHSDPRCSGLGAHLWEQIVSHVLGKYSWSQLHRIKFLNNKLLICSLYVLFKLMGIKYLLIRVLIIHWPMISILGDFNRLIGESLHFIKVVCKWHGYYRNKMTVFSTVRKSQTKFSFSWIRYTNIGLTTIRKSNFRWLAVNWIITKVLHIFSIWRS